MTNFSYLRETKTIPEAWLQDSRNTTPKKLEMDRS